MTTPRLGLDLVAAQQGQKHLTVNDALMTLDALLHLNVRGTAEGTPPENPEEGACYIVATGASGVFADQDGKIAESLGGNWRFYTPAEGWIAHDETTGTLLVHRAGVWENALEGLINPAPRVGVATSADATNRLAVQSPASLFTHDGTDHRMVINKAASTNTASLVLQDGYSGRAEIGLCGDDNLHVKVSADGAIWTDSMVVNAASGEVSFPANLGVPTLFNLFKDAGRFGGSPEPTGTAVSNFANPGYILAYNGATLAQGDRFIINSATWGGTAAPLGSTVTALVNKVMNGASDFYKRIGIEFFCLDITAGTGTGSTLSVEGVNHYVMIANPAAPLPNRFTLSFWLRCGAGSLALGLMASSDLYIDGVKQSAAFRLEPEDGWVQVTRVYDIALTLSVNYQTQIFNIYATPGTQASLAMPMLFPGKIPVGPATRFRIVPSLEAWR